MRMCLAFALVGALGACGDDGPTPGARDHCAEGGAINDCDDTALTAYAACDKLVTCGLIVRDSNDNGFDYGACLDEIFRAGDDGTAGFIVACIAASSCDQLETGYCFELGDN